MERPKQHEFPTPWHLARCLGQITVMYVQEKYQALLDKLDQDAWGEDSPEDAAIHSDVFEQRREAS